ncbi:MAG: hypothetical protein R2864_00705 [Syntrophotaleaceae bacterium]
MLLAKGQGVSTFIAGHVTKRRCHCRAAHARTWSTRFCISKGCRPLSDSAGGQNRFGSTNEIGVFEMQEQGLVEVSNPSELFLAERPESRPAVWWCRPWRAAGRSGGVAGAGVQHLFQYPRRTAIGIVTTGSRCWSRCWKRNSVCR